ncbi:PQQ-binding-like beta-propeller repeat protein [Stieleria marina]|uniref:Outer membrane biogenesis protein BamB n=1 Tax=Stieleria marina TaxID=1930275 RepID=A0A517NVB2_9BACT|nr:outer membrane biogenesis protein BamB [Planctomycetes bacterium K23_9]
MTVCKHHRTCLFGAFVLCFVFSQVAQAESGSWNRFHGIDGAGLVADGQIPDQWGDGDYAWCYKFESRDVGSPVVANGRVFLMASNPDQDKISLQAFDLASGKRLWSKAFDQPEHHLHRRNTFASSTPAADDSQVFVCWCDSSHTFLKCFDHEGNEIWSRDFGSWQSQHGFGTSPRIAGDMVLLFNSQQSEQLKPGQTAGRSRMIAVHRTSGATIWEQPLNTKRSCYGVPAIYTASSGDKQVIDANTGNGLFGLDIKSGALLWNLEVFDKRCCSTPLIVGDIAIGSCGSGGGGNQLVGVRIPKSAQEKPVEVYRIAKGAPYVPTPAVKDNHLYMVDDKGIASCIDAITGETKWFQRIGGNFGASPVIVGNKLLLISLEGEATVLKAATKFERISQFDLGGPVGATPAYADGRLILRVGQELRVLKGSTL